LQINIDFFDWENILQFLFIILLDSNLSNSGEILSMPADQQSFPRSLKWQDSLSGFQEA
jgi:hypothetical protein